MAKDEFDDYWKDDYSNKLYKIDIETTSGSVTSVNITTTGTSYTATSTLANKSKSKIKAKKSPKNIAEFKSKSYNTWMYSINKTYQLPKNLRLGRLDYMYCLKPLFDILGTMSSRSSYLSLKPDKDSSSSEWKKIVSNFDTDNLFKAGGPDFDSLYIWHFVDGFQQNDSHDIFQRDGTINIKIHCSTHTSELEIRARRIKSLKKLNNAIDECIANFEKFETSKTLTGKEKWSSRFVKIKKYGEIPGAVAGGIGSGVGVAFAMSPVVGFMTSFGLLGSYAMYKAMSTPISDSDKKKKDPYSGFNLVDIDYINGLTSYNLSGTDEEDNSANVIVVDPSAENTRRREASFTKIKDLSNANNNTVPDDVKKLLDELYGFKDRIIEMLDPYRLELLVSTIERAIQFKDYKPIIEIVSRTIEMFKLQKIEEENVQRMKFNSDVKTLNQLLSYDGARYSGTVTTLPLLEKPIAMQHSLDIIAEAELRTKEFTNKIANEVFVSSYEDWFNEVSTRLHSEIMTLAVSDKLIDRLVASNLYEVYNKHVEDFKNLNYRHVELRKSKAIDSIHDWLNELTIDDIDPKPDPDYQEVRIGGFVHRIPRRKRPSSPNLKYMQNKAIK